MKEVRGEEYSEMDRDHRSSKQIYTETRLLSKNGSQVLRNLNFRENPLSPWTRTVLFPQDRGGSLAPDRTHSHRNHTKLIRGRMMSIALSELEINSL